MSSYYHNWDALKTEVRRIGHPPMTPFTPYDALVDILRGSVSDMDDIQMHRHAKALLGREHVTWQFKPNYMQGKYIQSFIDGLPSASAFIISQYLGDVWLRRDAITRMARRAPVEAFDLATTMGDLDSLLVATEGIIEARADMQRAWFAAVKKLRSPDLVSRIVGLNSQLDRSSWWYVALSASERQWVDSVFGQPAQPAQRV